MGGIGICVFDPVCKKIKKSAKNLHKSNGSCIFAPDGNAMATSFLLLRGAGHAWDALPEKHQFANGIRRFRPSDSVGHRALKRTSDIFLL